MDSVSWDIPLRITLSLGGQRTDVVSSQPQGDAVLPAEGFELKRQGSDYGDRKGYDPHFLGVRLPLPALTEEQFLNAARPVPVQPTKKGDAAAAILNYEHFSIVMNRRRQIALYTVVNIDGATSLNIMRETDRWMFDPRIAESEQIGEALYTNNKLDRGHLVRRLDPVWGDPISAAKANDDTFHFTNCSPQHERFNQNNDTWQGIEDFLLDSARNSHRRLTVFTGPVLSELDPIYRGVRLPLSFWKIAVAKKSSSKLTATAFLLGQEDLINSGLERFEAAIYQVTVDQIQKRTGLNFSYLKPWEVSLHQGLALERDQEGAEQIRLTAVDQIIFQ
jgi:endonuclease G